MTYTSMNSEEEEAYKELVLMVETEMSRLSIDKEYHGLHEYNRLVARLPPELENIIRDITHPTSPKPNYANSYYKHHKVITSVSLALCLAFPSICIFVLFNERTKEN